MATLVIKTNVSQGTNVTIRDLGIIIPNSGGSLTFTTNDFLQLAKISINLPSLATDDAHGAGSSTIILNDGSGDIAQADVVSFLLHVDGSQGATGIEGSTGILGIDGVTGVVGNTGIIGIAGTTGTAGVTGVLGGNGTDGNTGIIGNTGVELLTTNTATATGNITTTSGTDIVATGMTLTPASGTYMVTFTGGFRNSNDGATTFASIWSAGSQVAASERKIIQGRDGLQGLFCCAAKVTVNGSQAIEGRWRRSANTGTMHERILAIIRVGA